MNHKTNKAPKFRYYLRSTSQ